MTPANTAVVALLAAAGLYEAAALGLRKFPTISEWVWRSRKSRFLVPVLWLGWGYLTYHFFFSQ